MTDAALKEIPVPVLGISISVNLSQLHAITLQTHVAQDEDPTKAIDGMTRQADRLIARYRLKDLRKNLKLNETQLKHQIGDVARIDAMHVNDFRRSSKKGEFKLTSQQEAQKNTALVTRSRFEELIADLKTEIAEVEAEAK